jgi:hypothetical protein
VAAQGSTLAVGEVVHTATRRLHVSERDVEAVARARDVLIAQARTGATITYGELVDEAELPYPPRRLGRLLILLSEDCDRRDEPTLACLVVTATTGEVGDGYGAGAADERAAVYERWRE